MSPVACCYTSSVCSYQNLPPPDQKTWLTYKIWECLRLLARPKIGFGKRGLLEKGSFQKNPFSRDSREFRDSRVSREPQDCGKRRRIRPFSRDSRESRDFRDSRDSASEKTPFVMTPFSGPDKMAGHGISTKKTKKKRPGPKFRTPRKYPQNTPKTTSGYFGGIFLGVPESGAGFVFFFSVFFVEIPCPAISGLSSRWRHSQYKIPDTTSFFAKTPPNMTRWPG